MKLQRYELYYNGLEFDGMREKEDGEFCFSSDVEALEAENAALHAENAELTSALSAIHDLAHDKSTGPEIDDGYWAIRALAGEALGVK